MQIEFIEPASIELDDAIQYYELQLKGLGSKFLNEVVETIDLIRQFPQSGQDINHMFSRFTCLDILT